jgi:hypothetical protein
MERDKGRRMTDSRGWENKKITAFKPAISKTVGSPIQPTVIRAKLRAFFKKSKGAIAFIYVFILCFF